MAMSSGGMTEKPHDQPSSWRWITEPYDVERPLSFFAALGEFIIGDVWQRGMTFLDQTGAAPFFSLNLTLVFTADPLSIAIAYPMPFFVTMIVLWLFPVLFLLPFKIVNSFIRIFQDTESDPSHRTVRITTYNGNPNALPTYSESVPLLRRNYIEVYTVSTRVVPIWARILGWAALVLAIRGLHLHK